LPISPNVAFCAAVTQFDKVEGNDSRAASFALDPSSEKVPAVNRLGILCFI
jgi:hypothetical protein